MRIAETALTVERLKELLVYNAETGQFIRRVRTSNSNKAGDVAGGRLVLGYISVRVDNRPYLAHRLAWFYVTGRWPVADIDHINGDPSDNRLCNLREATRSQNHGNMRRHKDNRSGYKGVTWSEPRQKWVAQIYVNGKQRNLGGFVCKEDAAKAYAEAARATHGGFARIE